MRRERRPRPFTERIWRAFRAARRELSGGISLGEGFAAARIDRFTTDWVTSGLPIDERLRGSLRLMRQRARELDDNNAWAGQYLGLLSTNVIGHSGFRLSAQVKRADGKTPDQEVNRTLEEGWRRWAEEPVTIDGKMNLIELEDLLVESLARDGEIFVRQWFDFEGNPWGYALEPIDPDLVDDQYNVRRGEGKNEVRLGIEVDRWGRPLFYHVWDQGATYPLQRTRRAIPAREMLHVYRADRVMQTRGITWLLRGMFPVKQLDGYEEAELIGSRVGAGQMATLEQKEGSLAGEITGEGTKEGESQPLEFEANPGMVRVLPPGYTMNSWKPDHPTTAYGPFTKGVLRKIAAAWRVFYNVLANDAEGVTYSTGRIFLLSDRDQYRKIQVRWASRFRTPVFRGWLGVAMLREALSLPSANPRDYWAVRWIPRGWPWIDPENDMDAGIKGIQSGLASRKQLLAEQGLELEDVLNDLKEEAELAKKLGVKIDGPPAPGASPAATKEPESGAGRNGADGGGRLAALMGGER